MLHRKFKAAFIATAVALIVAPAAVAHKPYREALDPESQVLPGCSFDVQFDPDGRSLLTIFDSGRLTIHGRGTPTLTNTDTGYSKRYRLAYVYQEAFDAESNQMVGEMSGRFQWLIAPGDVGPSGEVDPDGGLVQIAGRLRVAFDSETFAVTSFTMRGTLTDLCADLAP